MQRSGNMDAGALNAHHPATSFTPATAVGPGGAPAGRPVRQLHNKSTKTSKKAPVCNATISQFAIETYFIWFSALIFITELIIGILIHPLTLYMSLIISFGSFV